MTSTIIGSFTCNIYVVRMALGHTGIGNAGKFGLMQLTDIASTTISHTGTQTTNHLIYHLVQRAFIGIDAGSTTTKIVVTNEQGELLYTFYKNNGGNPIE